MLGTCGTYDPLCTHTYASVYIAGLIRYLIQQDLPAGVFFRQGVVFIRRRCMYRFCLYRYGICKYFLLDIDRLNIMCYYRDVELTECEDKCFNNFEH